MTVILLVDDMRSFEDRRECVVARSSNAAIRWLIENANTDIEELWLDHDLGGFDTGMNVVEHLETWVPHNIKRVIIHSSNPVGAERMATALWRARYKVEQHFDTFASGTFKFFPPEYPEFDNGVFSGK